MEYHATYHAGTIVITVMTSPCGMRTDHGMIKTALVWGRSFFFLSLKPSEYMSTSDYAIHYKMLRNPLTRDYAHVLF